MGAIKQLALNTVPQNIIVQSVCTAVTVKESESVANWPTTPFIIAKPGIGTDVNYLTAGKSYQFPAKPGSNFLPGQILGQIYLPSGSTTGIQDEA